MNLSGRLLASARPVIGSVEVFEPKTTSGTDHGLGALRHIGLDGAILEHGLDDVIDVGEEREVDRRSDAVQKRVAIGLAHAALRDCALNELLGVALASFGGVQIAVDEHDLDAVRRRDIGDGRAHHARAEHADFLELRLRNALRAARQLVGLALVHEQRADHVRRDIAADQGQEVFRLDFEAEIHRNLRAFVDGGQDRLRGGIIAERLVARHGVRGHEGLRRVRVHAARAARNLERLLVPGLHRLRLQRGQPFLRRRQKLACGHNLMDEAIPLRLLRRHVAAFEQQRQRGHDADQPRHALRSAARPGRSPTCTSGRPILMLVAIGADAVMAGERDLEAAAKRGAVDGAGDRLAAGLKPPQHLRQARDGLQSLGRRRGAGVRDKALHADQVRARDEARFAGGDDDALHGGVSRRALDGRLELVHEVLPDHIHGFAGLVDGEGGDAVAIDGV